MVSSLQRAQKAVSDGLAYSRVLLDDSSFWAPAPVLLDQGTLRTEQIDVTRLIQKAL